MPPHLQKRGESVKSRRLEVRSEANERAQTKERTLEENGQVKKQPEEVAA